MVRQQRPRRKAYRWRENTSFSHVESESAASEPGQPLLSSKSTCPLHGYRMSKLDAQPLCKKAWVTDACTVGSARCCPKGAQRWSSAAANCAERGQAACFAFPSTEHSIR